MMALRQILLLTTSLFFLDSETNLSVLAYFSSELVFAQAKIQIPCGQKIAYYDYRFGNTAENGPQTHYNNHIYYYQHYYGAQTKYLECHQPYSLSEASSAHLDQLFEGLELKEGFIKLKKQLRYLGFAVPVLYKQYAELSEPGGTRFLGFNIDPDFSDCVDGFVVVDIDQMSAQKRKRYGLLRHRLTS